MCAVAQPAASMRSSIASAAASAFSSLSGGSWPPPWWPGSVGASTSWTSSSALSSGVHARHVSVNPCSSRSGLPLPPWCSPGTCIAGES